MIVEDERDLDKATFSYYKTHSARPSAAATIWRDMSEQSFAEFIKRHGQLRDSGEHTNLKESLVKHLWFRKGFTQD